MRCTGNHKILAAALLLASAISAFAGTALDNEIKQRLNFVDMFIGSSAAAKRIAASNNEEAKTKYQAAQASIAEARSAFSSGNLQETQSKADEAMALMSGAAKLVPSESMQKMTKARNEQLVHSITTLQASYKSASIELGAQDASGLDSAKIQAMLDAAQTLSAEGKHDEANKILAAAMQKISGAVNKLLAGKTISYEMKFSFPAEEYAYEVERYYSLESAIPLAIDQMHPTQAAIRLAGSYINKGKEKQRQADADAQQQNFAAALEKIRDGTQQMETALKVLGVSVDAVATR